PCLLACLASLATRSHAVPGVLANPLPPPSSAARCVVRHLVSVTGAAELRGRAQNEGAVLHTRVIACFEE
ncbi:MAG: hypothetical protein ACTHJM_16410, partial [Marmoricola sp.]